MNRNRDVVRDGYRIIADEYHRGRLAKEAVNVEWLDGLREFLPSCGRVTDLGCGGGVPISRYFVNRGYLVTGYDLSEEMLPIARQEVPNASFELTAIEDLRLNPSSVDLVVSFFAIIHVDRALHEELYARIYSWLRGGGAALLSLGAEDNPNQQSDDWHGAPMAWSHFDAETNLALLARTGFELRWHEVDDFGDEKHLIVIAEKPSAS